jgi:regulator of sigma E protease
MVVLLKTLQVILALSILIFVHELGHYLFARLFGIRVDKFYLFFDIGGKRLFSTKNSRLVAKFFPKLAASETDYGIGWLPLGGYCKIAGMVDESMDTEFLNKEPQPWEFRVKPAWQRLLVMAGGVLFNFILAIILYIVILASWGSAYLSNENRPIWANELAQEMGFKTGDQIVGFDGQKTLEFDRLQIEMVRDRAQTATVIRGGDTLTLYIDQAKIGKVLQSPGMFSLALPFVVDTIPPASVNYGCSLQKGDQIIALDQHPIRYVQDARVLLQDYKDSAVTATYLRATDSLTTTLQVDSSGLMGIFSTMPALTTREYSFLEAIPAGFELTFSTIQGYIDDLKLVFTPSTQAYKSVGSFISIGQIFPASWDWYRFVNILALLSIMLGVMNLIPIPGLDGGHILFTLYEIITRRKPGEKFLYVAQIIGMVLLMGLMILAFGNDIFRLFR